MRTPWILMLLILAAAGVGGATWLWGLAGTGLVLTGAACMGIGYLARQRMAPLPHAPDTQPDSGHPIPEERVTPPPLNPYLKLNQEVAAIARKAPNLPQALHDIGQLLHTQLGSRSWICLRVEGWNGESSLLRPWTDTGSATSDMIDLTAFATTHKDDAPAGQALNRNQPTLASVAHARTDSTYPWREVGTGQILALPITTEGWPQALVEFSDPKDVSPSMMAVLEVAAIQLGFVAQRDANLARMASHAEHLGRLTLVASRISSGVAITDRDGTIEWINSAFIALTGWSEEQVIGRQLPDLLQQEAADGQTLSELREHIARGVPFRLSYEANRHTPQTITRYWGEIDAIQMLDESGGRSQYVCLFNDITRRKAQEHVREQEREFLEALLGHLPVSLFVLDAVTMNVVAINRYTEQEFDLQRDQVVGRPIDQAIGSTILNLARPHMQAAIVSGQAVEHDLTFELDGSAPRVVNARHFALRHGNGSPRLLISLVRDITAARQAQADLEESERRFRELVESMDDAVYVADGLREHYLYLSPQITALLGMPPEEMQEAPGRIRTMVIPDDAAQMQQQEALERAGQPTDILVRMDIPERGQRWIRHRTRTRALPDGQRRIYGLVSDVTAEHTQALELQRTRDAAEAASKAKSQFMTNMSHEIRTPMNGILGMTELLLGTALNDKQRRFAQAVYRSGESLLEIINDILDFAKIEAGRIELASSDFVLRTVVEDTLELMAPRAHEKGLELNFREQPGLPSVIHGDPLRLRQILTNLVANAIKFTEHGEVVVDIRRALGGSSAQPGAANPPIDLEFMVRDTGIGIAPEMMPRLFTAFTQANSSMARRYGGTGLGLAISKQLVEMMGGHIEAHSAPAVGSEFVFRIPVHVGETQADMALLDEPGMPSLNVLVVDDNDTNRTVVENMLSAWGMRVTQATNGREAFDLLTADPQQDLNFDLALIDMNMPEMNGLELADAIRHSGRYRQLKMVLLSSVSSPDDARRAQDAGFQRFLSKPLRKAELRQAILGMSIELGGEDVPPLRLNKYVLVVEDNTVNQEVCSQMLRRLGCDVRVASSAQEGLRRLGEERFDLILMDIQMPGMDGIEALNWFRRGSGKRFHFVTPPDTPIIAVTANALEGDEQRFKGLGFNDYLSKPFRQSQLQKILQACTDPGSPVDEASDTTPEDTVATTPLATPPAVAPVPPSQPERPAPPPVSASDNKPPPATDLLDAAALRRLHELDPRGENRLLERVAQAFDTSVGRLLPQLEEAFKIGDHATVMHVAHTLKSSSASIGALKLSQMCAEIEGIIRRQTGEDLSSRIRAIPQEADLALEGLRQLLEPQT